MANVFIKEKIRKLNVSFGYSTPEICPPEELIDEKGDLDNYFRKLKKNLIVNTSEAKIALKSLKMPLIDNNCEICCKKLV